MSVAESRKAELVSLLSRSMLRRSKESTIGHLLKGKEDNVVFCSMAPVQRRVYHRILDSPDFQLLLNKDKQCR